MKITIDKSARDDLENIYGWILADRPDSADLVIGCIFSAISHLERLPNLGHKGRERGTYEWLVRGLPYVVVYEVNHALTELTVVAVFHSAQEQRHGY